ncbi:hypothetical protein [Amycolatopsis cihanbeyliensis]|uniref:Uncharacterized protein n=1 Tax=Amycolatopsis cihanbeyliensis TaxID=1128664 RepID=A0A542DFB8_AMYCI|nr:hypothetical protein [Amycolatopsis cihanbeyliensis]TQJ01721.1 hypothetical protein FB471_1430 [Amycolatopsis cihanbeyliensis]
MSTAAHSTTVSGLVARALHGVFAGLAGGVVFGILMAMMDMLPMVAMLVGSQSAVVGALVHLVISAGIGASFAVLFPMAAVGALVGAGAIYGAVWWVLGALIIMPAWLGMPVFMFNNNTWFSLMGHVVFGMVAGTVLFGLRRRGGHA